MNPNLASRRVVIVMAKRPAAGHTKTRLAPALSPVDAAGLYECFLLDTIDQLRRRNDCEVIVAIDHVDSAAYFTSIAPDIGQVVQHGDSLGDRLDAVIGQAFERGFVQVFAIGSDSPDLPADHLTAAFAALDDHVDVVFGPSDDGGYYLIGQKKRWSRLLTEVTMSTPSVLQDTLAIAAEAGATVALAPEWYDVDAPADLDRLRRSLVAADNRTARYLAQL